MPKRIDIKCQHGENQISKKVRLFKKRLEFKYGDFCKCGCGQLTLIDKSTRRFRKYVDDHHHRIRIGTKHSTETINKMKEIKLRESNPVWKNYELLGYSGIHIRMRKEVKKPELCNNCNLKKPLELANKSGKYKNDTNDWEWLCRRCHMICDNRIKNLRQYQNA